MKDLSSVRIDGPNKLKDSGRLYKDPIASGLDTEQIEQALRGRPHPTIEQYRDALERDGFAYERGQNIQSVLSASALDWIKMAREAGRCAPLDQNRGGREAGRHRYYSAGVYVNHAAAGTRFVPCPPFVDASGELFTTFLQPPGTNRDYDTERRFDPFPETLIRHDGLQQLVDLCFQITPSSLFPNEARDWLRVGLHLVCLHAEGVRPGMSSPNRAHVDGELCTSIVMVERVNVIGGASLVVEREFADAHPNEIPSESRLADITLEATLDILTVDDRRVAHYVFPVFAGKNTIGHRTVLLVDFTPLITVDSEQLLARE
ncbi:2OG-Fe dioxygenase family protein [Bradyrhizobium diazoefficiens]|uniref:2OG-Fe dioxygenase family protein n=1 Tax=Bradyrhizobium diazoefficiens TaxID=1355477 RepID=UPI0019098DEF|nr:2OG-Fe dioxygenase family protein [Bradyrhizobium diazoefficiens]MBK3662815.1 2OG-Fe dioxygenase family protein [Bradyrhizobium diazoefficiens]